MRFPEEPQHRQEQGAMPQDPLWATGTRVFNSSEESAQSPEKGDEENRPPPTAAGWGPQVQLLYLWISRNVTTPHSFGHTVLAARGGGVPAVGHLSETQRE